MKNKNVFYKVINVVTGETKLFNFYDLAIVFVNSQGIPRDWHIIEEGM